MGGDDGMSDKIPEWIDCKDKIYALHSACRSFDGWIEDYEDEWESVDKLQQGWAETFEKLGGIKLDAFPTTTLATFLQKVGALPEQIEPYWNPAIEYGSKKDLLNLLSYFQKFYYWRPEDRLPVLIEKCALFDNELHACFCDVLESAEAVFKEWKKLIREHERRQS